MVMPCLTSLPVEILLEICDPPRSYGGDEVASWSEYPTLMRSDFFNLRLVCRRFNSLLAKSLPWLEGLSPQIDTYDPPPTDSLRQQVVDGNMMSSIYLRKHDERTAALGTGGVARAVSVLPATVKRLRILVNRRDRAAKNNAFQKPNGEPQPELLAPELRAVIVSFPKLQNIDLQICVRPEPDDRPLWSILDTICKFGQRSVRLEASVDYMNFREGDNSFLHALSNLSSLSLFSGCSPDVIAGIIRRSPELKSLTFPRWHHDDAGIDSVVQELTPDDQYAALEHLKLRYLPLLREQTLRELPHLRSVEYVGSYGFDHKMWTLLHESSVPLENLLARNITRSCLNYVKSIQNRLRRLSLHGLSAFDSHYDEEVRSVADEFWTSVLPSVTSLGRLKHLSVGLPWTQYNSKSVSIPPEELSANLDWFGTWSITRTPGVKLYCGSLETVELFCLWELGYFTRVMDIVTPCKNLKRIRLSFFDSSTIEEEDITQISKVTEADLDEIHNFEFQNEGRSKSLTLQVNPILMRHFYDEWSEFEELEWEDSSETDLRWPKKYLTYGVGVWTFILDDRAWKLVDRPEAPEE